MFGNRKRGKQGRAGSWQHGEANQNHSNDNQMCCCEGDYPLTSAERGCCCRIRRHHAQGAVRQRLLDMGFIPNSEVEVVRVATLGDPIEVKVGDSWVTLRKSEADKIEVTDC